MSERITHVAIIGPKGKPWALPAPNRHWNVIRLMAAHGHRFPINGAQGFVTDSGRFVDRIEGKAIAVVAGQYRPTVEGGLTQLFSEDLW